MDGLKEIFAAFEARVRSKVVGSVILTFIATNWKVIFYIIFAKKGVEEKFTYFDDHTNEFTLIVIPLVVGIGLAAILPWVNFLGMKLTSFPDRKQRQLKNSTQHLDVIDKLEYETKLQEIKARQQKAIVESAKAGEAAKSLKDPDVRQQVREEFEEADENFPKGDKEEWVQSTNVKESFIDWSLEELESGINALDAEIQNFNEGKSTKMSELEALEMEEIHKREKYFAEVEKLTKNEDFKSLQNLKISRAKEIENYQENLNHIGHILGMVSAQLNKLDSKKSRMMLALEERFEL